jgi:hypothetical protein
MPHRRYQQRHPRVSTPIFLIDLHHLNLWLLEPILAPSIERPWRPTARSSHSARSSHPARPPRMARNCGIDAIGVQPAGVQRAPPGSSVRLPSLSKSAAAIQDRPVSNAAAMAAHTPLPRGRSPSRQRGLGRVRQWVRRDRRASLSARDRRAVRAANFRYARCHSIGRRESTAPRSAPNPALRNAFCPGRGKRGRAKLRRNRGGADDINSATSVVETF